MKRWSPEHSVTVQRVSDSRGTTLCPAYCSQLASNTVACQRPVAAAIHHVDQLLHEALLQSADSRGVRVLLALSEKGAELRGLSDYLVLLLERERKGVDR